MGMFEEKKEIRQFTLHPSRPEKVLKVPGLSIIHQAQIYGVPSAISAALR
jgi:hypothetical protein